ncbi:MAG: HAD family hydrolase [Caulobacteraceae bacterium]
MYNCAVFDVDGTLIDTEKAIIKSLQKVMLEESGKAYEHEELFFALGIPGAVTLSRLGIKDTGRVIEKWLEYMDSYKKEVSVFPGIREVLEHLSSRGVIVGIVTSKTKIELERDMTAFGLLRHVAFTVCADDTKCHKPHGEPILKFMEISGAVPSKTIYVGDTIYDMKCAKAAGVDFGLALWGTKDPDGIEAVFKFTAPRDMLNLFLL